MCIFRAPPDQTLEGQVLHARSQAIEPKDGAVAVLVVGESCDVSLLTRRWLGGKSLVRVRV